MSSVSGEEVQELVRRLGIAEGVEKPSSMLLSRSMRILGSSISASRPDIHQTLSSIKGRLVRSSGTWRSKHWSPPPLFFFQMHWPTGVIGCTARRYHVCTSDSSHLTSLSGLSM